MANGKFSGSRENPDSTGYDEHNEDFLNDPIFDGMDFEDVQAGDYGSWEQDYQTYYGADPSRTSPGRPGSPAGNQNSSSYGYQEEEEQTYGDSAYEELYEQNPPKKKRRRGPRITGVIFYLLFFTAIGVSYFLSQKSLETTKAQLEVFEQAQPVHICQQVFEQLFTRPDWAALYEKAGIQDSTYEGCDAYVAYMQEKVGTTPLTFTQLTFDENEPLQYGVYLDQEQIGLFTMVNESSDPAAPRWNLGTVELYFTPEQDFRIHLAEGQIPYVNGVALDDSHVIQQSYVQSLEDESIRMGGTGIWEIRDLLVTPEVTVKDTDGKDVPVTYAEDRRLFQAEIPEDLGSAGEEEQEIALEALRTYCKFMINKAGGRAALAKHFKKDSDTYKAIVGSDLTWIQRERSFAFADESVTDYVRYSSDRFSVRASLTWQLTRPDGSVKESLVDESMVFEKIDGKWLCTRMTGLELTEPVTRVRLSFEGSPEGPMIDQNTKIVDCPQVTAPEGKTFAGWMAERSDAEGKTFWQRLLVPDAQGRAEIYPGFPLEPMHLYPIFEPAA